MDDQNLVPSSLAHNCAQNLGIGGLGNWGMSVGKGKHVVELHCGVGFASGLFNFHYVAGSDAILLTACADHCVHKKPPHAVFTMARTKLAGLQMDCRKVLKH